MTRKCSRCEADTDYPTGFNVRKDGGRGGYVYPYCKLCHNKYTQAHYRNNSGAYKAGARRRTTEYRREARTWLAGYFTTHPCVDCGEDDPIVLEFDHIDPTTKGCNVARLIGNSRNLDRLFTEVGKCLVRCANCHRRRHHNERARSKIA